MGGKLQAVDDPWAWTCGADPFRAQGAELTALIARANDAIKLKQIAKARHYRRGWIAHVLRGRAEGAARGALA